MVEDRGTKVLVSFGIEGRMLNDMLTFLRVVNVEIPIRFYKDRMLVLQKSPDNVQYVQIEIRVADVLNYELNVDGIGDNEKEGERERSYNIIVDTHRSSIDNMVDLYTTAKILNRQTGICHPHLLDRLEQDLSSRISSDIRHNMRDEFRDELPSGDYIFVNIYEDRITFECPENVILWAKLIEKKEIVEEQHEKLIGLYEKIKTIRNNENVKFGSATLEPMQFRRVCRIESDNKYKSSFLTEVSKESGLVLSLKSTDGFYMLVLKPGCLSVVCGDGEKYSSVIDRLYMMPIALLRGKIPLKIEIRTNKPVVIEQSLVKSGGICAMLTVAPRVIGEESETNNKENNENNDQLINKRLDNAFERMDKLEQLIEKDKIMEF